MSAKRKPASDSDGPAAAKKPCLSAEKIGYVFPLAMNDEDLRALAPEFGEHMAFEIRTDDTRDMMTVRLPRLLSPPLLALKAPKNETEEEEEEQKDKPLRALLELVCSYMHSASELMIWVVYVQDAHILLAPRVLLPCSGYTAFGKTGSDYQEVVIDLGAMRKKYKSSLNKASALFGMRVSLCYATIFSREANILNKDGQWSIAPDEGCCPLTEKDA